MKYDMAGGAAMLGAMRAIALLKPKVRVIAHRVRGRKHARRQGAKARRCADGDVGQDHRDHQHRRRGPPGAGRWPELCEATGRDPPDRRGHADRRHRAWRWAWSMRACSPTTTKRFEKFEAALEISGEKFWRMPLGEEYADLIKSDIGDIKNTGGPLWRRDHGRGVPARFRRRHAVDSSRHRRDGMGGRCAAVHRQRPERRRRAVDPGVG